jgi:hypothetical protein
MGTIISKKYNLSSKIYEKYSGESDLIEKSQQVYAVRDIGLSARRPPSLSPAPSPSAPPPSPLSSPSLNKK